MFLKPRVMLSWYLTSNTTRFKHERDWLSCYGFHFLSVHWVSVLPSISNAVSCSLLDIQVISQHRYLQPSVQHPPVAQHIPARFVSRLGLLYPQVHNSRHISLTLVKPCLKAVWTSSNQSFMDRDQSQLYWSVIQSLRQVIFVWAIWPQ